MQELAGLTEIKVKDPGVNIYFKLEDGGLAYHKHNDPNFQGYWAPYDEDYDGVDGYVNFNISIDREPYNTDGIDNPEKFIKDIEEVNPDVDLKEFKLFIDNLIHANIPIDELYTFTDGGWAYIDVTLKVKDIIPYIKK